MALKMDKENSLFEIVVGTYEKYLLGYYLKLYSEVRFNKFCATSVLQSFIKYMYILHVLDIFQQLSIYIYSKLRAPSQNFILLKG